MLRVCMPHGIGMQTGTLARLQRSCQRQGALAGRAARGVARRPVASAAAAQETATAPPAVGDVVEGLRCTSLAYGSKGVCKLPSGYVVFVERALPGELLSARVTAAKRSFGEGAKVATLEPHAHPAEPACAHFGPCGGCTLQSLQYSAQLEEKERQVAELLGRVAGVESAAGVLRPIVPAPQQLGYRNKFEFSFSTQRWEPRHAPGSSSSRARPGSGDGADSGGSGRISDAAPGFALGLHRPGSHTQVLPITDCKLQSDAANAILQLVQRECAAAGRALPPWDPATRRGLLQHLVIRRGRSSSGSSSPAAEGGQQPQERYLVNIVTSREAQEALAPLAKALQRAMGTALAGVVNTVAARGRPQGERRLGAEHVLLGEPKLVDTLCGLEFELSPNSFFQTNTQQAEALYGLVAEAAELRPKDVLLDLYCGAGSIGLSLARSCRQVFGVEVSTASVGDARRNAKRNNIGNTRFIQADLARTSLGEQAPPVDVVVVDPSRPGLAAAVVDYLQSEACAARRLVYVSCNPATQARDLRLLCGSEGAWRLEWVRPVDMYPQTAHVETVAALVRA